MLSKTTFLLVVLLIAASSAINAQSANDPVRTAVEQGNWSTVKTETAKLRASDPNSFTAKNYDYLLSRASEQTGDSAGAASGYQSVVARNARLAEYAFWHLSRMARATGDLTQEREHLRRLVASSTGDADGHLLTTAIVTLVDLVAKRVPPTAAVSSLTELVSRRVPESQYLSLRSEVEQDILAGRAPDVAIADRTRAHVRALDEQPGAADRALPAKRPPTPR